MVDRDVSVFLLRESEVPLNAGGSGEEPICDTLRSSGMDLL